MGCSVFEGSPVVILVLGHLIVIVEVSAYILRCGLMCCCQHWLQILEYLKGTLLVFTKSFMLAKCSIFSYFTCCVVIFAIVEFILKM